MRKLSKILPFLLLLSTLPFAGEMPFPQVENGKLSLHEKDSPYILEQGVVLSSTDTFAVEPGVTVLMGEYAKIMLPSPSRSRTWWWRMPSATRCSVPAALSRT